MVVVVPVVPAGHFCGQEILSGEGGVVLKGRAVSLQHLPEILGVCAERSCSTWSTSLSEVMTVL